MQYLCCLQQRSIAVRSVFSRAFQVSQYRLAGASSAAGTAATGEIDGVVFDPCSDGMYLLLEALETGEDVFPKEVQKFYPNCFMLEYSISPDSVVEGPFPHDWDVEPEDD